MTEFHVLGSKKRRIDQAVKPRKQKRGIPNRLELRARCSVCNHTERLRIEMQLANGGASYRGLAKEFGLNYNAVENHFKKHMSPDRLARLRLSNPLENNEVLADLSAKTGVSAIENLRAIHAGVVSRWLNALESESDGKFIALTAQARQNIELLAKLSKELVVPAQTNINVGVQANISAFERPEYIDTMATVAAALRPFPEAREAVAKALRSLEIARGGKLIEHRSADRIVE